MWDMTVAGKVYSEMLLAQVVPSLTRLYPARLKQVPQGLKSWMIWSPPLPSLLTALITG